MRELYKSKSSPRCSNRCRVNDLAAEFSSASRSLILNPMSLWLCGTCGKMSDGPKHSGGFSHKIHSPIHLPDCCRDLPCPYWTVLCACGSTENAPRNLSCWLKLRTRPKCGFVAALSQVIIGSSSSARRKPTKP